MVFLTGVCVAALEVMNTLLGFGLTLLLSTSALAMGQYYYPSPSGNYCRDEANAYIARRFGEKAKVIAVNRYGTGTNWEYWVKTNVCDGWFVMRYMNMEHVGCTQGHYRTTPTEYLNQVWGYGDCAKLIRNDYHPRRPNRTK